MTKWKWKQEHSTGRVLEVKDGHNKQPVAIVVLSDKLQATDVEKVEALSKAQVEEKAPGFAPRLLSSTIDIEVKRGVEKKQPITLCFKVDKRRLPSPAQQQQDKQRPDGGCRKVFPFIFFFENGNENTNTNKMEMELSRWR